MKIETCKNCGHELDSVNHLLMCNFKKKRFGNENTY